MKARAKTDDPAMSKGGYAPGLDPKGKLVVTEKHFPHRAATEIECYDCGNLIAYGEPFNVSNIECVKGMQAKSHRLSVHLACYDVVGRAIAALGMAATHTFEGRPSLADLWKEHHADIQKKDKALAAMLEAGLGKP